MNIDYISHEHSGENITARYMLNNEETSLEMAYESLIEHVEYEGLNEGERWTTDELGDRVQTDIVVCPIGWTDDNTKEALESYLKYFHKSKSFN